MEFGCKRAREDAKEEEECFKKICNGLGIEEDEEEFADGSSHELITGVMKSLEEEINLSSGSSTPARNEVESENVMSAGLNPSESGSLDLSYLLEASDDELGIGGCSSPALSEADLSCSVLGEEQKRVNNILEFLDGEVISLDFAEFQESDGEWLKRAVATLDVLVQPGLESVQPV